MQRHSGDRGVIFKFRRFLLSLFLVVSSLGASHAQDSLDTDIGRLTTTITTASQADLSTAKVQAALKALITELQSKGVCNASVTVADCRLRQLNAVVSGWTDSQTLTASQQSSLNASLGALLKAFGPQKDVATLFVTLGNGFLQSKDNKDLGTYIIAQLKTTTGALGTVDPTTIKGKDLVPALGDLIAAATKILTTKDALSGLKAPDLIQFGKNLGDVNGAMTAANVAQVNGQIAAADITGATTIFNAFAAAVTKDPSQLKDADQYTGATVKLNDLVVAVLTLQSQIAARLDARSGLSNFLSGVVKPLQDIIAKLPSDLLNSQQLLDDFNTLGGSVNTAIKGEATSSKWVANLNIDVTAGLAASLVTALGDGSTKLIPGSDTLKKQALTAYLTNADTLAKLIISEKQATVLRYSDFSGGLSQLSSDLLQLRDATRNIDVLGAWYGDTKLIGQALKSSGLTPWSERPRFCTATAAMRSLCEGRTACFQPVASGLSLTAPDSKGNPIVTYVLGNPQQAAAPAGSSQISGSSLCGYEPAPYANSTVNGLVVAYQCKAMTQDAWKTQPRDHNGPTDLPWITAKGVYKPNGKKSNELIANASEIKFAVLRSGVVGEIRCSGQAGEASQ